MTYRAVLDQAHVIAARERATVAAREKTAGGGLLGFHERMKRKMRGGR